MSSSLAADSARTSLKRARELFDRSSYSAFIPKEDDRLREMSLARRLRTQYNQNVFVEDVAASSTAIVAVKEDSDSANKVASSTLGVLTKFQEKQEAEKNKPQGILVVSSLQFHLTLTRNQSHILFFPYRNANHLLIPPFQPLDGTLPGSCLLFCPVI